MPIFWTGGGVSVKGGNERFPSRPLLPGAAGGATMQVQCQLTRTFALISQNILRQKIVLALSLAFIILGVNMGYTDTRSQLCSQVLKWVWIWGAVDMWIWLCRRICKIIQKDKRFHRFIINYLLKIIEALLIIFRNNICSHAHSNVACDWPVPFSVVLVFSSDNFFFIQMLIMVCLYHSLGYTLSTSWIFKLNII